MRQVSIGVSPRLLASLLLAALVVSVFAPDRAAAQDAADAAFYHEKIAPIFEAKCIACHSCYNAPCQLNLQGYSGAARGATVRNVYDATRLESVPPTRIDVDAPNTDVWRRLGFFDVIGRGSGDAGRSLLLGLTRIRQNHAGLQPGDVAAESLICPSDPSEAESDDAEALAQLGMPYGLPPLSDSEIATLEDWVERGAPGPELDPVSERASIPTSLLGQVRSWEAFLNAPDPRQKLVSRYLYEHLFLAHLHFTDDAARGTPPPFFRLVRSRTPCDEGVAEIPTRRPTDPPGTADMAYCLRPMNGAIVDKTHIPYALSGRKLARLKELFLDSAWEAPESPSYAPEQANNPFLTYAAIPVRARYQFLLDDAQYHVATFIKGPVCNGSAAVNSIQEQFYVFFLDPEADGMVMLPEFEQAARSKLVLPGQWGSDIELLQDLPYFTRIVDYREDYRRLRADSVRQLRPKGYSLEDIWDGDDANPNALLTVFRHDDNAAVVTGAVGDLPKTVFVMDYALFERLVYNLVVNFDVFGNVGHQVLTRVYMDLIRMEAEELFLSFLPPEERRGLREHWYEGGLLTDIKMDIVFPLKNRGWPTAVDFGAERGTKRVLIERLLFDRFQPRVRGPVDPINWRRLAAPDEAEPKRSTLERALRPMASVVAADATPFARFFPDLALLLVRRSEGQPAVYSIAHNRDHENVSWIMGEDLRLSPERDRLAIVKGVLGAYPNMLFVVDERKAAAFALAASGLRSEADYEALVDRYGVARTNPKFWEIFGEINAAALADEPVDRGVLDLTRYSLEAQ